MRKTIVVLTLLGLAAVPVAAAHVEPTPEQVPPGKVSRITLSVEGEGVEGTPAVGVTVRMPRGVTDVVAHPTRGWKQAVKGRRVTWSGGTIAEGAEAKFAFSAKMPDTPGQVLVFPSLVTYQDGTVQYWIGTESSDTPAPRVTLTGAKGQVTPPPPPPPPPAATTPTTTATEGDGGSSNTWIWIVIAAAILGSLAAILVVRVRSRRT